MVGYLLGVCTLIFVASKTYLGLSDLVKKFVSRTMNLMATIAGQPAVLMCSTIPIATFGTAVTAQTLTRPLFAI
jgi:hypothetical protein